MSHHHQHLPRAVVTTRLWAGENTMFSKALTFPSPRFDSIWVIGQPGRNGGTSRAGEAPGTSCLGSRVGPGAGGSPSRALAVPKQSDSASTCATCSLAPGIRVAGRALPPPPPPTAPPFHIVVSRDQGQATAAPPLSASQPRPSSPRERKADTKAELPPNWGPENRGPQTTQGVRTHEAPTWPVPGVLWGL